MHLTPYSITLATLSDKKDIVTLVNSAYRGDYSKQGWTTEADLLDGIRIDEERVAELISTPGHSIHVMREASGRLLGCVHLNHEKDFFYVGMLTIEPTMQSQGLGKFLLDYAEKWARDHSCPNLRMTVINLRPELIRYYERRGYHLSGKKEDFPVHDPRFGIPKKGDLHFVEMVKRVK